MIINKMDIVHKLWLVDKSAEAVVLHISILLPFSLILPLKLYL